jgi:hypothetical protein
MKNEFIPYEQALALKELGFDEPCLAHLIGFGDGTIENGRYKIIQQQVFYPNDYTTSDDKAEELGLNPFGMCGVPLYQQSFRWFREKYGLMHIINPYYFTCEIDFLNKRIVNKELGDFIPHDHLLDEEGEEIKHSSYEEAESACLKKLIEIIKDGTKINTRED